MLVSFAMATSFARGCVFESEFSLLSFFLCRWFILFCIPLRMRMRMQTHSSTIMIFSLSTFVVQHFFHWNSQGAVIYIFICVAVAILLLLLLLRFFFLNYDRVIVISVEGKKTYSINSLMVNPFIETKPETHIQQRKIWNCRFRNARREKKAYFSVT